MRPLRPLLVASAPVAALAVLLTGCASSSNNGAAEGRTIRVDAQDTSCTLSGNAASSGVTTFQIKNNGSQLNEFYIYNADGTQIITEKPNIGPGLSAPGLQLRGWQRRSGSAQRGPVLPRVPA